MLFSRIFNPSLQCFSVHQFCCTASHSAARCTFAIPNITTWQACAISCCVMIFVKLQLNSKLLCFAVNLCAYGVYRVSKQSHKPLQRELIIGFIPLRKPLQRLLLIGCVISITQQAGLALPPSVWQFSPLGAITSPSSTVVCICAVHCLRIRPLFDMHEHCLGLSIARQAHDSC